MSETIKVVVGIVMIALGIVLGVYVGIWVCFIGGIAGLITAVVNAFHGMPIDAWLIAISLGKVVFASFLGVFSALVLIVPGTAILADS